MTEHFFNCPYCWKRISMLFDPSVSKQNYVEDCENCCNPIEIDVAFENEELVNFESSKLGQ